MILEEFIKRYQKVPVEEFPNNVLVNVPEPLVSCRISTYQHASYIRKCIDGVLMQKINIPIEIVIGEDESNDGTREICVEYAKKHPNLIRLLLHKRENNILINGKPSPKFQSTYTMYHCRGKYMAICEGDDYWTDPYKLQKQVDFMEANEDYSICCHNSLVFYQNNEKMSHPFSKIQNDKDISFENVLNSWVAATASLFFKKANLFPLPKSYFNPVVTSGDQQIILLSLAKGKMRFFREIMSCYRISYTGFSQTALNLNHNDRYIENYIALYESLKEDVSGVNYQSLVKAIHRYKLELRFSHLKNRNILFCICFMPKFFVRKFFLRIYHAFNEKERGL